MITLKKNPNKDFIILNLTDPQLGSPEWVEGHLNRNILEYTVTELMKRAQPDLITISGDLAWAGDEQAYKQLGELLESFQTPWAFVWGNHDNQNGAEAVDKIASYYLTLPHCIYEKGDPALGNGNYVIAIEENGKIVEALIMMDSHNRDVFVEADGTKKTGWAKLIPEQLDWYRAQIKSLKEKGCKDSTLILHIPIYAYYKACVAAYKADVANGDFTMNPNDTKNCWNKGYENSVGVMHESISCYPFADDGVFEVIKEEGLTKYILAGHDHVNNWIITYDDVKLIYGLKTGAGCYWEPLLNGGTILKINQNGVYEVFHEFVDVSHIVKNSP